MGKGRHVLVPSRCSVSKRQDDADKHARKGVSGSRGHGAHLFSTDRMAVQAFSSL